MGMRGAYGIVDDCRAEGLDYVGEELEEEDPEQEVGHHLLVFPWALFQVRMKAEKRRRMTRAY